MSQTKAQLISGTSTQDVTFDDATVSSLNGGPIAGARNRIINGDMRIDQRNAGASVTPTSNTYTLDRWFATLSQASKFSVQQNAGSVAPPAGFTNYLGVTSLSAYTVGASEGFNIRQGIEGFNFSDLDWGTANAKTITVSFWVRSSLTGTFGGSLFNSAANRSYPFSYSVSSANTWEQKIITVAGDTTGTWLTNSSVGVWLNFGLGVGSSLSGTAGAWAGAFYGSATGATSVVGTNGATFYITGVQLEAGSVATPFERRSYGQELSLCQRYYLRFDTRIQNGNAGDTGTFNAANYNSNEAYGTMQFAPMRTGPSLSYSAVGDFAYYTNNNSYTLTSFNRNGSGINRFEFYLQTGGSWTGGHAGWLRIGSAKHIALDAEL